MLKTLLIIGHVFEKWESKLHDMSALDQTRALIGGAIKTSFSVPSESVRTLFAGFMAWRDQNKV